jgi:hypothetical protein
VVIFSGASLFRSRNLDQVLESLKSIVIDTTSKNTPTTSRSTWQPQHVRTQEDLDYGFQLLNLISSMKDCDIRVESPWLSIYTSSKKDVDRIIALGSDRVKYVSLPSIKLDENIIVLPKINYDYRVTLGKTIRENTAFVDWASSNKNLKLTKSCTKDLVQPRSWGGTYFYITGENNLLMAKMHLGGAINKIERIVKA